MLTIIQSKHPAKKSTNLSDDLKSPNVGVVIEMNQRVMLTFSLKYLVNFTRSSTRFNVVQLMMSNGVPLPVSNVCRYVYHTTLTSMIV